MSYYYWRTTKKTTAETWAVDFNRGRNEKLTGLVRFCLKRTKAKILIAGETKYYEDAC